jgi:hypothetical protein
MSQKFDNLEITPTVKNLLAHIKNGDIDGEYKHLTLVDKELLFDLKNFETAQQNKHSNRYPNILASII